MSRNDQCVQLVWGYGTYRQHRCSRKAVMGGYCKQHSPETVAKRQEEQEAKYLEKRKRHERPFKSLGLATAALKRIANGSVKDPVMYAKKKLNQIEKL